MRKYALCVISAGCLWGVMGLFSRGMGAVGIAASGIIVIRCGISAVLFALTIALTDRSRFRVAAKDLWCFLGSGLCSTLVFSACYYRAIDLMSLSAAAVLLYTAPAFVMLMSLFIFREKLTGVKITALALSFAGCVLASGVISGGGVTAAGLLSGLGAGFCYALYSVFARLALDRGYSGVTVNFYSCALAALGASLIWGAGRPLEIMCASWDNAALCVAAAVLTCYLPYALYTFGLSGMEAGRASIMASTEPVVATVLGAVMFGEPLTLMSAAGVALILSAVTLLNLKGVPGRQGSSLTP